MIGLIGLGYWGKIYMRTLEKMDIEFIACTRDYEKLILEDPNIDRVIIATPTETHYEIVLKSMIAGKHVLVEKPFVSNSEEAVNLLKMPYITTLMVGHIYLYHPAIIKIKELIKKVGNIKWIEMYRKGGVSDKNSLWELGSHDLYILNYLLFKEPNKITKSGYKREQDIRLFYDNFMVNIENSTVYDGKIRDIIIAGDKGIIIFDDTSLNKLMLGTEEKMDIIKLNETTTPLENQISHFNNCVDNNETPLSDGFAGLKNIEMIEKC